MSNWAEEEVQTADLDDQRLNKRLALLLEQLGEHPQLSITRSQAPAWECLPSSSAW
jgi:Transposase DNA-binding